MEEKREWSVYMHVFPNGRVYIGTAKDHIKRWGIDGARYNKQPIVWEAIQKYGWNNIEHIIVSEGLTQDEGLDLEEKLIAEYHAFPPEDGFGYNATTGGKSRRPTDKRCEEVGAFFVEYFKDEKHRDAASTRMQGRIVSEETRAKLSKAFKGRKGFIPGEETRAKLSAAHKGRKPWNTGIKMPEEYCKRLGDLRRGKKQKAETVAKRAEKSRKWIFCEQNGKIYHSQREAASELGLNEAKISEVLKGTRKHTSGYTFKRVEKYTDNVVTN